MGVLSGCACRENNYVLPYHFFCSGQNIAERNHHVDHGGTILGCAKTVWVIREDEDSVRVIRETLDIEQNFGSYLEVDIRTWSADEKMTGFVVR